MINPVEFLVFDMQRWHLCFCHDRVTPCDSARPLVCYRLKSDRDWAPPTLHIHLHSDN